MNWSQWIETKRYQDLVHAVRSLDGASEARIIKAALAETTGAEQAFWQALNRQRRWQRIVLRPEQAQAGWQELRQGVAEGPDDPENLHSIIHAALSFYVQTEDHHGWATFVPLVRPYLRLPVRSHTWHLRIMQLRLKQRRWRAALQAGTRALSLFAELTPAHQQAIRGHLVFMHSMRSVAATACGRLDLAAQDVTVATAIEAEYARPYLEPYDLIRAQAELSLARGEYPAARAALQEGMARSTVCQHKLTPYDRIQFDLIAARIGRAEGNMPSFHHFCEQALARCLAWDLRMSEVSVRAIMAGAER